MWGWIVGSHWIVTKIPFRLRNCICYSGNYKEFVGEYKAGIDSGEKWEETWQGKGEIGVW